MSEKNEPIDEIEQLSQMLDELNDGQHPECSDKETAELLKIADFIRMESPPLPPPQHILDQTVDRALAEIKVTSKKKKRVWWYSGALGSAAAVILVMGLNLLPTWQQQVAVPPLQTAAVEVPSSTATLEQPSQPIASENMEKPAQLPTKSAPAPAVSNPVKKQPKPPTKAATPPPPDNQLSFGRFTMMSETTPDKNVSLSAAPTISPLNLPGQTPNLVVTNQKTGAVRQVYFKGTQQELTIIQYRSLSYPSDSQDQQQSSHSNGDINTVHVTIADQDVTLIGHQSSQELLKIAASLTP